MASALAHAAAALNATTTTTTTSTTKATSKFRDLKSDLTDQTCVHSFF